MDLILWRHAHAEGRRPGLPELARALTARGQAQAGRVAGWLREVLPQDTCILSSPARRCEQTVLTLGREYRTHEGLAPDRTVDDLLEAAQWPSAPQAMLLVGHNPVFSQTLGQLLKIKDGVCPIRKGAAWWLRTRQGEGGSQVVVVAVTPPDFADQD